MRSWRTRDQWKAKLKRYGRFWSALAGIIVVVILSLVPVGGAAEVDGSLLIGQGEGELSALEAAQVPLRFHILAHSDDPFDQALKARVRDAVLAQLQPDQFVVDGESAEQLMERFRLLEPKLLRIADETLHLAGVEYGADIEYGFYEFPEKRSGDLVLAAGVYPAVRILLGDAQGENWWCVLYPNLCSVEGVVGTQESVYAFRLDDGEELVFQPAEPETRWAVAHLWKRGKKTVETAMTWVRRPLFAAEPQGTN